MKKLKFDREYLLDKIKKVYKFIPSNTVIPAQENIKFTVKGEEMEMVGGDAQCQIKMFCKVKSSEDISFCLPATLLMKTIDLLVENELTFTLKGEDKIEIKSGKSKYNISSWCKAEDYPMMPMARLSDESEFIMYQHDLRTGIRMSKKFIDNMDTNVSNQGININNINNKIIFTALDRKSMGRTETSPVSIGAWFNNFILPKDSANKIASLLNDTGEIVICHGKDKMILFTDDTVEKFEIITTSMTTAFPDSEMLFRKKKDECIILNTSEFRNAIKRLKLYSEDGSIKLFSMSFDGNETVTMTSSNSAYQKDGEEVITVKNSGLEALSRGFDSDNILNILSCIYADEMSIHFSADAKIPVFIKPVGEDQFCFLAQSVKV
jgi:DNA polymerase-3 subunit beta